jgi:D-sedoheptulose 7-phosphate isomerase
MIQHRQARIQFAEGAKLYLEGLRNVISDIDLGEIATVADVLVRLAERGGTGYVFGNGGSASTAAHFVNDLGKVARAYPSYCPTLYCLNDNVAVMTAIANDDGYEYVFSSQLNACLRPVDLVIAISTRGMSKNVLSAVESAKARGAESLAFVGFDGGKLINMVDNYVLIPSRDMQQVEDLHLALGHMVARMILTSAPANGAAMENQPG